MHVSFMMAVTTKQMDCGVVEQVKHDTQDDVDI